MNNRKDGDNRSGALRFSLFVDLDCVVPLKNRIILPSI